MFPFLLDLYNYSPISFTVASLALGQSYDCPSASEVILKDMGKIGQYKTQQSMNHVQISWDILYLLCSQLRYNNSFNSLNAGKENINLFHIFIRDTFLILQKYILHSLIHVHI